MRTIILSFFLLYSGTAFGAHPLITDDTGTQGEGRFQVEINSKYGYDSEKEGSVTINEAGGELATIMSYGIRDNMDIVLGLPYQWLQVKEDDRTAEKAEGVSDISLELKWRFFEKDGLSLALKPGITFPTGDDEKGLGTGRVTSSICFIATREIEAWAFHLNLGYIRNENKANERKGLWHVSLASEVEALEDLKIVANIGIKRNADKETSAHPAFILGGIIYSLSEKIAIDAGVEWGLNKPETDYTVLAGIALRF